MELNVIENKKSKIIVEIKGEDHSFCNALKNELQKDKNVKVASYAIEHPLVSMPRMIVETESGTSAKSALTSAAKKLASAAEKFKKEANQIK